MADPQVATKLTPAQWGTQFREENPNYFRYGDIDDPAEFADAMRSVEDIDDIVDFSKYDGDMTPTGSFTSKIPVIGGVLDAALNIGTRKPESIMVGGEETAVGAHIFGDDSKAWYGGQRFISGIPTFITGQIAGGFDEQSAYSMVTESVKKDGNGNALLDENGMMDWVDGNGDVHKVSKEDMLERADNLRSKSFLPFGIGPNWKESEEWLVNKTMDFWSEHNKRQDKYLAENPGVQGYLQWQEETPFSYEEQGVRQFVHPQMIARAVADMLPSMTVGTLLGGAPGAVRQTFKAAIGQQTVKQGLKNLTVGSFAQVGGMTLMEGSGQMEESLNILVNELKMDPSQAVPIAASTALVVGIINGLLEKLQFTKIARYGAFDDEAKTLLTSTVLRKFYDNAMKAGGVAKWMTKGGEFLIDNVEEGVIEAMQEINGLAMSKALESGNAATPEEAMDLYHRQFSNMENMKEMASSPEAMQAFFTGAAGGSGMSAATSGLSRILGGKEQVSIGIDEDPTDGKPGFMVNIGGKIQKIVTKDRKTAEIVVDITQKQAETEGFAVPGLNKSIQDISTLDELLIALADQVSNGALGNVADIWKKGTGGRSLDHSDLTDAQIILDTIFKDNSLAGPKFNADLAMQMVIDKGGIEILDKIKHDNPKHVLNTIRATILANIKNNFTDRVNQDIKGEVPAGIKANTHIEKAIDKEDDFLAIYNDETQFTKDLNAFLSNNVDEGTAYQSSKGPGPTEQSKIDAAKARTARNLEILDDPDKGWDVKDLWKAAEYVYIKNGYNGLRSFLAGSKGKTGYKGLSEMNLKVLMDTYGIDYQGKERKDWIKSLVKAMGVQAISAIEIKTKQKKATKKKPKTTEEKMGAFFGEEEATETPTEEIVKTDTGESITITPTGEGVTPASAIAKGLDMISGEDATNFAGETAQELNEDNYDNTEEETDDISDIIGNCGRGI